MTGNILKRYVFVETNFRKQVLVLFAVLFVFVGLHKYGQFQVKMLTHYHGQQELLARGELIRKTPQKPDPQTKEARIILDQKEYLMKGVSIQKGEYYVLINKGIYREGEMIGHFTVSKIDPQCTVLEDLQTHEKKFLYLPVR